MRLRSAKVHPVEMRWSMTAGEREAAGGSAVTDRRRYRRGLVAELG